MSRRLSVLVSLACVVALLALAAPCGALMSRDRQMKQAVLLLCGYIDRGGAGEFFLFPTANAVRRGGALPAPIWPRDPWSGAALTPGSGRGHYRYWVSSDRRSYRLTGYLSSSTYVVKGGMPGSMMLAYNHRTREGAALVQQFIELWARRHDDVYPAAGEVARHGGVGEQAGMPYWPSNPWNHAPLTQGSGRAHFEYGREANGSGYKLTMHLAFGKVMVLTDRPFDDVRQARLALKDETTRRNVRIIQGYVDEWALLHAGALPAPAELAPAGAVGDAHDYWPDEPYSGSAMTPGDGLGHYAYTINGDGSYTIAAPLAAAGAGIFTVTARPPAGGATDVGAAPKDDAGVLEAVARWMSR